MSSKKSQKPKKKKRWDKWVPKEGKVPKDLEVLKAEGWVPSCHAGGLLSAYEAERIAAKGLQYRVPKVPGDNHLPTQNKRDMSKLPKWAQAYIAELRERVKTAERTIPWTKPGMEWFTVLHPDTRLKLPEGDPRRTSHTLFILRESAAHPVCSIGPDDCLFVGRGKARGKS